MHRASIPSFAINKGNRESHNFDIEPFQMSFRVFGEVNSRCEIYLCIKTENQSIRPLHTKFQLDLSLRLDTNVVERELCTDNGFNCNDNTGMATKNFTLSIATSQGKIPLYFITEFDFGYNYYGYGGSKDVSISGDVVLHGMKDVPSNELDSVISPYDHNSPSTPFTDIVFLVGTGKKKKSFYCNKMFMSFISPVFQAMLLGDFQERKSDSIELKDIDPTDFKNMLDLVYPVQSPVTEKSVGGLLHVADCYQIQSVTQKCEKFLSSLLSNSGCSDFPKYLYLADRYRLEGLLAQCLAAATTDTMIAEIVNSKYVDMISEKTVVNVVKKRFKKT